VSASGEDEALEPGHAVFVGADERALGLTGGGEVAIARPPIN
jgi:hypothetical protein